LVEIMFTLQLVMQFLDTREFDSKGSWKKLALTALSSSMTILIISCNMWSLHSCSPQGLQWGWIGGALCDYQQLKMNI
jgi:hypothetical protein